MASACYARVLNCVSQVLHRISPGSDGVPYTILNMIIGGNDTRPGRDDKPLVMYTWVEGGYGARPGKKDRPHGDVALRIGNAEHPDRVAGAGTPSPVERFEYLADAEGAGMHRGGFGVEKSLTLQSPGASITCQGDRGARPVGYAAASTGPRTRSRIAPERPTRSISASSQSTITLSPAAWCARGRMVRRVRLATRAPAGVGARGRRRRASYGPEVEGGLRGRDPDRRPELLEYEVDLEATKAARSALAKERDTLKLEGGGNARCAS